MSATGKTPYFSLAIYNPDDITSWLKDFNNNMMKIDEILHNLETNPVSIVQEIGDSETSVMSQKAVTDLLNTNNQEVQQIQNKLTEFDASIEGLQTSTTTNGENISALQSSLNNKQDLLQSGLNIKSVNGNSLLGGGNLNINGGHNISTKVTTSPVTAQSVASNTLATVLTTNTLTPGTYLILASVIASAANGSSSRVQLSNNGGGASTATAMSSLTTSEESYMFFDVVNITSNRTISLDIYNDGNNTTVNFTGGNLAVVEL